MKIPHFTVIEGGGPGPKLTLSDDAAKTLGSLSDSDLDACQCALQYAYGQILRLLFDMANNTFHSRQNSLALSALSADNLSIETGDIALKCCLIVDRESCLLHLHVMKIATLVVIGSFGVRQS